MSGEGKRRAPVSGNDVEDGTEADVFYPDSVVYPIARAPHYESVAMRQPRPRRPLAQRVGLSVVAIALLGLFGVGVYGGIVALFGPGPTAAVAVVPAPAPAPVVVSTPALVPAPATEADSSSTGGWLVLGLIVAAIVFWPRKCGEAVMHVCNRRH